MSDIYLELTVANIKDPERQQEVSFLVDTGATRTWISQEIADAIGIETVGTVPLELADGSIRELPYGFCLFVYDGEVVAGNVVIGPPESEPLVGTHVLQDFRMIVDMDRHEITRGQAMRAKEGRNVSPEPIQEDVSSATTTLELPAEFAWFKELSTEERDAFFVGLLEILASNGEDILSRLDEYFRGWCATVGLTSNPEFVEEFKRREEAELRGPFSSLEEAFGSA